MCSLYYKFIKIIMTSFSLSSPPQKTYTIRNNNLDNNWFPPALRHIFKLTCITDILSNLVITCTLALMIESGMAPVKLTVWSGWHRKYHCVDFPKNHICVYYHKSSFANCNIQSPNKHEGADIGVAAPKVNLPSPTPSVNGETGTTQLSRTVANPSFTLAAKLGLPMPNLAPDIDSVEPLQTISTTLHRMPRTVGTLGLSPEDILNGAAPTGITSTEVESGMSGKRPTTAAGEDSEVAPKKKKYAKEAWPGKRPGFLVGPSVVWRAYLLFTLIISQFVHCCFCKEVNETLYTLWPNTIFLTRCSRPIANSWDCFY